MAISAERIKAARKRLIEMHHASGVGHIGGNLSCLDAMLVLHHDVMKDDDAFVLSKGHAAGALYIALWSRGRLADEELKTFHADGTRLSGHPPARGVPEVLFATGSLGHGVSLAAGLALAARLKGEKRRVFCLTSDGEWEEGSNWEALIFAAHRKLAALTLLVDANGLQGFGTTKEVASLEPLGRRFEGFGIAVREVDGHDPEAVAAAAGELAGCGPGIVVLRTHKGHGVSFMEDRMDSHYLPFTDEKFARAMKELEGA